MARKRPDSPATTVLQLIDEAFDHKSWHGTNLLGSVRRLTAEQAEWRSGPGRHSIADIVVHCAYWKYAVRRRLRGDKRGSFPLKGSNWFTLPSELSEADWTSYVALLTAEHRQLREAVAALPAADLPRTPPGKTTSNLMVIQGAALHDVYHAGQIQVIKSLHK